MTTHPMLLISKGPSSNFALTTYWCRDIAAAALFFLTNVGEGAFSEGGVGHPRGGSYPLLGKSSSHPRLIYYNG
jgi:hypothetical protein